jgi:hypothetical protein
MNRTTMRGGRLGPWARLGRWWNQWPSEEVVFGKPEWFTRTRTRWGIRPIGLPGWAYAAVWSAVITIPFLLLVLRDRPPEAIIWLIGSMGTLTWDVRKLARALDAGRPWSRSGGASEVVD